MIPGVIDGQNGLPDLLRFAEVEVFFATITILKCYTQIERLTPISRHPVLRGCFATLWQSRRLTLGNYKAKQRGAKLGNVQREDWYLRNEPRFNN